MEFPDFGEIFRSAERSTSTNNNSSLPIEIATEKRCAKFIHSCLYNNNMIIKITSISALTTDRSQFGDTYRYICYKCKIPRNSCFLPIDNVSQYIDDFIVKYVCTRLQTL